MQIERLFKNIMMINKIRNKNKYSQVMDMIEIYLIKATNGGGFNSLSKGDADDLQQLSLLAEKYEDDVLQMMPLPVTVNSIVTIKMEELNINQIKLAKMLNIGPAKLSQILNGNRKPDLPFLKAVHQNLIWMEICCWKKYDRRTSIFNS